MSAVKLNPAHAGIQVTDRVRHTVEKRYPGELSVWMPACAGMTDARRLSVVHIIPSQVFSQEDMNFGVFDFRPNPDLRPLHCYP